MAEEKLESMEDYAAELEASFKRLNVGDIVTIMSFAGFTPEEAKEHLPDIIVLNEKNEVIARRKGRKVLPLD